MPNVYMNAGMETEFPPWLSLAGGVLIGLSVVLLMALHGIILGATGILAGLILPTDKKDWIWRAAPVTGPLAYMILTGGGPEISGPVSGRKGSKLL